MCTWFLIIAFVHDVVMHVCLHVCMCVCPSPRLLIISGVIWTLGLKKGYSFHMAAIVVVGMALEVKHVIETTLIRVSYHCISH